MKGCGRYLYVFGVVRICLRLYIYRSLAFGFRFWGVWLGGMRLVSENSFWIFILGLGV